MVRGFVIRPRFSATHLADIFVTHKYLKWCEVFDSSIGFQRSPLMAAFQSYIFTCFSLSVLPVVGSYLCFALLAVGISFCFMCLVILFSTGISLRFVCQSIAPMIGCFRNRP